jgi:hypothetical protein
VIVLAAERHHPGEPAKLRLAVRAAGQMRVIRLCSCPLSERAQGQDVKGNMGHHQPPTWPAAAASCGGYDS